MPAEKVLEISQLTKNYGKIRAIDNLSLSVNQSEVFGLLGPNGSGKTTTLSIVSGILKADSGSFSWFNKGHGHDLRKKIGPLIEVPQFYPYLSLADNLLLIARIKEHGYHDIDRVLDITRLSERKKSKFSTLSLGMKQRLGIASALLGDPDILVLDEPTNGLDPEGIAEVREIILQQAKAGKTILMASHILSEVEKVCTHLAILKKGKLIGQGSVAELLGGEKWIEISCDDNGKLEALLQACPLIRATRPLNHAFEVNLVPGHSTGELNQYFFEKGIVLSSLVTHKKTLESQFLELVKGEQEL